MVTRSLLFDLLVRVQILILQISRLVLLRCLLGLPIDLVLHIVLLLLLVRIQLVRELIDFRLGDGFDVGELSLNVPVFVEQLVVAL